MTSAKYNNFYNLYFKVWLQKVSELGQKLTDDRSLDLQSLPLSLVDQRQLKCYFLEDISLIDKICVTLTTTNIIIAKENESIVFVLIIHILDYGTPDSGRRYL